MKVTVLPPGKAAGTDSYTVAPKSTHKQLDKRYFDNPTPDIRMHKIDIWDFYHRYLGVDVFVQKVSIEKFLTLLENHNETNASSHSGRHQTTRRNVSADCESEA